MAKARAMCRCATCGKEFEKITVKNNRAEADSWEKWAAEHFDECDDCREKRIQKERAEASKAASESASELGLPVLTGSEKQIAWAETIRMEGIENLQARIDREKELAASGRERHVKLYDELVEFQKWILAKSEAKFWINVRAYTYDGRVLWNELRDEFRAEYIPSDIKNEMAEEKLEIVEPEEKKHTVICKVSYDDQKVTVTSKYDPDMPPIVKAEGYKWNGSEWIREMSVRSGSAEDRAAEIANKLLCTGFPVEIKKDIRGKAVNGTYEPEHKRWVSLVDSGLKITGDVDTKGIPGIRKGIAPVESYEAVEEFARLHDYRFTLGARNAIDTHKAKITKATPIPGKEAEYNDTADGIKNILDSSRDVLEDLKEAE